MPAVGGLGVGCVGEGDIADLADGLGEGVGDVEVHVGDHGGVGGGPVGVDVDPQVPADGVLVGGDGVGGGRHAAVAAVDFEELHARGVHREREAHPAEAGVAGLDALQYDVVVARRAVVGAGGGCDTGFLCEMLKDDLDERVEGARLLAGAVDVQRGVGQARRGLGPGGWCPLRWAL